MTTGEGGDPGHAGRGGRRARRAASATRAARPTWARSSTTGSASTTGSPTCRPRSASRSSSGSTRCSTRATTSPRSTASGSPQLGAAPAGEDDDRRHRPALREPRRRAAQLVRLRASSCPTGTDRDAVIAALGEQRDRLQGVSALHPPAAALPRALRLHGRRVPGRRARRRALARAAVLHLDDRVAGRPGLHGARRGARNPALDSAHVPLRRRTGPALPADQLLDLVRLAPGAIRRRAVEGARPRARASSACSTTPSCEQIIERPRPGRRRARAGQLRVPRARTRTSTWRSSGG